MSLCWQTWSIEGSGDETTLVKLNQNVCKLHRLRFDQFCIGVFLFLFLFYSDADVERKPRTAIECSYETFLSTCSTDFGNENLYYYYCY